MCMKKVCQCVRTLVHRHNPPISYQTQRPPVPARWEPLQGFRSEGREGAGLNFEGVVSVLNAHNRDYVIVRLTFSDGKVVRGQAHEVDDSGILRVRRIPGTGPRGTIALVKRDGDCLYAEPAV